MMGIKVNNPPYVPGNSVQVVNVQTGAVATGSTLIPDDDTIPQNDEGDEYMTLAITPKSSTNKLKIEIVINLSHASTPGYMDAALFQDDNANALASSRGGREGVANNNALICFTHFMISGTTSETTFKVRAGTAAGGITTFNGVSSARIHGGVLASSITITEIKV